MPKPTHAAIPAAAPGTARPPDPSRPPGVSRTDGPPRASGEPPPIASATLLQGRDAITIEHNGRFYQLRQTRQGKLILTK